MIILRGLGWRTRAAFYRNSSSSFCSPPGHSPKKAGSSQLAGERGRGRGSGRHGPGSTLAPAGHVLTGGHACPHPRARSPHPGRAAAKINKSLCLSFRRCVIMANMRWRRRDCEAVEGAQMRLAFGLEWGGGGEPRSRWRGWPGARAGAWPAAPQLFP